MRRSLAVFRLIMPVARGDILAFALSCLGWLDGTRSETLAIRDNQHTEK